MSRADLSDTPMASRSSTADDVATEGAFGGPSTTSDDASHSEGITSANRSLSAEVGRRLRERREQLGMSLRETAELAAVSPGHLSEVETGQTFASLPVLLRLGRVMRYPLAEMLPRIGGHRIRSGSLVDHDGAAMLSHPELDLNVVGFNLTNGDKVTHIVSEGCDCMLFVVSGRVELAVSGRQYQLEAGDSADIQLTHQIDVAALTDLVAAAFEVQRH